MSTLDVGPLFVWCFWMLPRLWMLVLSLCGAFGCCLDFGCWSSLCVVLLDVASTLDVGPLFVWCFWMLPPLWMLFLSLCSSLSITGLVRFLKHALRYLLTGIWSFYTSLSDFMYSENILRVLLVLTERVPGTHDLCCLF